MMVRTFLLTSALCVFIAAPSWATEEAASPEALAIVAATSGHATTVEGLADAPAAHGGAELDHQHWHFSGIGGTYDRAALQRGYKVYREVCAACHAMKRVYFHNLEALGYNENQIKNIAAEYTITDGPDDEGEMFDRPGRASDHFKSPFPNEQAAKYANNGALPPDLSLIAKARHHGPDYIYSLLTGFEPESEHPELEEGKHYNKVFPGHVISMAPPLSDDIVAYEDGTPQTTAQYARDVTEFLAFASDPYMEERKRTGIKAILFLLVFAGVMYAYKRKIWETAH